MPLYKDRLYEAKVEKNIKSSNTSNNLSFVNVTYDVFDEEPSIDDCVDFCDRPHFRCRVTNRGCLTFQEALSHENKIAEKLARNIDKRYWPLLLRAINGSNKNDDNLTQHLVHLYNKTLQRGDAAQLIDDPSVVGKIIELSDGEKSPASDKENKLVVSKHYTFQTSDNRTYENVPAMAIQRYPPIGKDQMKQFLRLHASKGKATNPNITKMSKEPWIVDVKYEKIYELLTTQKSDLLLSPRLSNSSTSTLTRLSKQPVPKSSSSPANRPPISHEIFSVNDSSSSNDSILTVQPEARLSLSGIAPNISAKKMQQLKTKQEKQAEKDRKKQQKEKERNEKKQQKIDEKKRKQEVKVAGPTNKSSIERFLSNSQSSNNSRQLKVAKKKELAKLWRAEKNKQFNALITMLALHLRNGNMSSFVKMIDEALGKKALTRCKAMAVDDIPTRDVIVRRIDMVMKKDEASKMTDDEWTAYFGEKGAEMKKILLLKKQKVQEIEDTLLENLQPLEDADDVVLQDGVTHDEFARALHATEFMHTFKDIIQLSANLVLKPDELLKIVMADRLNNEARIELDALIALLIKAIIKDSQYSEYKTDEQMKINCMPVWTHANIEMARVILKRFHSNLRDNKNDAGKMNDVNDNNQENSIVNDSRPPTRTQSPVDDNNLLYRQIAEFNDIMELPPPMRLQLIVELIDLLTYGDSVYMYIREIDNKAGKIMREYRQMKQMQKEMESAWAAEDAKYKQLNLLSINKYVNKTTLSPADNEKLAASKKLEQKRQFMLNERQKIEAKLADINESYITIQHVISNVRGQEPIGVDRNNRRYYNLSVQPDVIYVQTSSMTDKLLEYNVKLNDDRCSKDMSIISDMRNDTEVTLPEVCRSAEPYYRQITDFDGVKKLMTALDERVLRESALKKELQKLMPRFEKQMTNNGEDENSTLIIERRQTSARRRQTPVNLYDKQSSLVALRSTMIDMVNQIIEGGMSTDWLNPKRAKWEEMVHKSNEVKDLAKCMLIAHSHIRSICLKNQLEASEKRNVLQAVGVLPNKKEDGDEIKKPNNMSRIERWQQAVENSTTLSRLHFLLAILDSSINWSKSIDNARCRTCRKSIDPDKMLICDLCNDAHHMYCLEPPLDIIPDGKWFCAMCQAKVQRIRPKRDENAEDDEPVIEAHLSDDDEVEDDEEEVTSSDEEKNIGKRQQRKRTRKLTQSAPTKMKKRRVVTVDSDSDDLFDTDIFDEEKKQRGSHNLQRPTSQMRATRSTSGVAEVFSALEADRFSHSLCAPQLPKRLSSRRRDATNDIPSTLTEVKAKLPRYTNVKQLLDDVLVVCAKAKKHYSALPRKLRQLNDFQSLVEKLISDQDCS